MHTKLNSSTLLESRYSIYLLLSSALVIFFSMLGGREIWTLEGRWAEITLRMIATGDYLHPLLKNQPYYEIPPLSYWFIVVSSKLTQTLNLFSLRFASAIAALITLFCTYSIGQKLWHRRVGLLAGWMLCSTYYFVFWGRVASAEMLQVAGILTSLWWYLRYSHNPSLTHYLVFFLLMAATALCKNLQGPLMLFLIILPHQLQQRRWRNHRFYSLLFSGFIASMLYLLPLTLSFLSNPEQYPLTALLAFDRHWLPLPHPQLSYLLYLPLYTLPWSLFLWPIWRKYNFRKPLTSNTRWLVYAVALVLLLLIGEGTGHSHNVLPLVPLTLLLIAQNLEPARILKSSNSQVTENKTFRGLSAESMGAANKSRQVDSGKDFSMGLNSKCQQILERSQTDFLLPQSVLPLLIISYIGLFLFFNVAIPVYYSKGGNDDFSRHLEEILATQPNKNWRYVLLDVDMKLPIWLNQHRTWIFHPKSSHVRRDWLELSQPDDRTVFITKRMYLEELAALLPEHQQLLAQPELGQRWRHNESDQNAVAFIPIKDLKPANQGKRI